MHPCLLAPLKSEIWVLTEDDPLSEIDSLRSAVVLRSAPGLSKIYAPGRVNVVNPLKNSYP